MKSTILTLFSLGLGATSYCGSYIYSKVVETDNLRLLQKDLKKFKTHYNVEGVLIAEDLVAILTLLVKYSKLELLKFKAKNNENRRFFLLNSDLTKYKNSIKTQFEAERIIWKTFKFEALDMLKIEEESFKLSIECHKNHSSFERFLLEIELGDHSIQPYWPKVSKSIGEEIFIYLYENDIVYEMDHTEGAKALFSITEDIEEIERRWKTEDAIYEKFKVEIEEFDSCRKYFKLDEDPEVQEAQSKSCDEMLKYKEEPELSFINSKQ
mmetsp:Transcript_7001/g.7851  ORF Transcript_7001/g.7851 Transcript_7001/m.7851 type:complete len:267 (-) Transcript_7001:187-987(-)